MSVRLTWLLPAGSLRVTVAPLGAARWVVSSVAATLGLNGTFWQPVGVKLALSALTVTVAGRHEVGSVMKALSSVRRRLETAIGSSSVVESRPPSGRRLTDAWFLIRPRMLMPRRAGSSALGSRL